MKRGCQKRNQSVWALHCIQIHRRHSIAFRWCYGEFNTYVKQIRNKFDFLLQARHSSICVGHRFWVHNPQIPRPLWMQKLLFEGQFANIKVVCEIAAHQMVISYPNCNEYCMFLHTISQLCMMLMIETCWQHRNGILLFITYILNIWDEYLKVRDNLYK